MISINIPIAKLHQKETKKKKSKEKKRKAENNKKHIFLGSIRNQINVPKDFCN